MGEGQSKPTPEEVRIADLKLENEKDNQRNEQMLIMQQKLAEKEREALQGEFKLILIDSSGVSYVNKKDSSFIFYISQRRLLIMKS